MNLVLKIFVFLFGILIFAIFFTLIKKRTVKPFYNALWLAVSIFVLSISPLERFYKTIATKLGISDASFLVIVGFISFLLVYVLYLSIKISELSNKIQELISHSSILEHEIRKLKNNEK